MPGRGATSATKGVNIGPGEQVAGIEVLDASEMLEGLRERKVHLENLTPG